MRFVCTASRLNYAKVLTMTNDADRADAKRGGTPWFSISVLLSKDHSTTGRISRNQIRKIGTSVFGSLKLYILDTIIRDLKGFEKATIRATCRIFALDPLADSRRFPRFFRDVSSQKSLATRLVSRKLPPPEPAFSSPLKKPSARAREPGSLPIRIHAAFAGENVRDNL